MRPNDPVMVMSLGVLPLGARVLDDHDGLWIDVVTMGQHLPQRYRDQNDGVEPLDADKAVAHGLCPACLGYGTLTLTPAHEIPLATTSDEITNACSECGGTGRPAIRVEIVRTPGGIESHMQVLPHQMVPGNEMIPCLACGFPADEPFAKHT